MTSERLAVISRGVTQGEAPARIFHFPEGMTVLDASIVVEDAERYSAEDLIVVCEGCLVERHPGLEQGLAAAGYRGTVDRRQIPLLHSEPGLCALLTLTLEGLQPELCAVRAVGHELGWLIVRPVGLPAGPRRTEAGLRFTPSLLPPERRPSGEPTGRLLPGRRWGT